MLDAIGINRGITPLAAPSLLSCKEVSSSEPGPFGSVIDDPESAFGIIDLALVELLLNGPSFGQLKPEAFSFITKEIEAPGQERLEGVVPSLGDLL